MKRLLKEFHNKVTAVRKEPNTPFSVNAPKQDAS